MLTSSSLIPINTREKNFELLMNIYQKAANQVVEELEQVRELINYWYGYEAISNITARIKTPKSIIEKMKKKNYALTYQNLITKINDIAGIRIVCPLKTDIYTILNMVEQMPNIKIINRKDYISKPKESGYSGYHLIIQTMVVVENKQLPIKVEIQLRTMAMDFWATNEHKIKYKTNKKLSSLDSKKLTIYAKILNMLDNKIMKIAQKQNKSQVAIK